MSLNKNLNLKELQGQLQHCLLHDKFHFPNPKLANRTAPPRENLNTITLEEMRKCKGGKHFKGRILYGRLYKKWDDINLTTPMFLADGFKEPDAEHGVVFLHMETPEAITEILPEMLLAIKEPIFARIDRRPETGIIYVRNFTNIEVVEVGTELLRQPPNRNNINTLVAIEFFNREVEAANHPQDLVSALWNRSGIYYARGLFHKALKDSQQALQIDPHHFRALAIKARSHFHMQQYTLALESIMLAIKEGASQRDLLPGEFNGMRMVRKLSETGVFQLSIRENGTLQIDDLGEYVGPVEIRQKPDGVGLFATQEIGKKATILLNRGRAVDTGYDKLEISRSPKLIKQFRCFTELVCTGSSINAPNMRIFQPNVSWEQDLQNEDFIFDLETIERTSAWWKKLRAEGDVVWLLSGFVNHSCTGNATFTRIDNARVCKAIRTIKAGEEVLVPYVDVLTYDREEWLKERDVRCRCSRCKLEKQFRKKYPDIEQKLSRDALGLLKGPLEEVPMVPLEIEAGLKKDFPDLSREEKTWIRTRYLRAYALYYHGKYIFEGVPTLAEFMQKEYSEGVPTFAEFMHNLFELNAGSLFCLAEIVNHFPHFKETPPMWEAMRMIYGDQPEKIFKSIVCNLQEMCTSKFQ